MLRSLSFGILFSVIQFHFVEKRISVIYLSTVGIVMITKPRYEDKSTACGCNRHEKIAKDSKKKLQITVGFKVMKTNLINSF